MKCWLAALSCSLVGWLSSAAAQPKPASPSASVPTPAVATGDGPLVFHGEGMGTKVQLVAYAGASLSRSQIETAFAQGLTEMNKLDQLLSDWRSDSDVGRVNQAPGQFVLIDARTVEIVETALWVGRLSSGAFDITFQGMGSLWKFGDAAENPPRVPSSEQVERGRQSIDYRRVELDKPGSRLKIGAGQQLGLGGIAKGYIVERMATSLKAGGLNSFLVQAGGDLIAVGVKPDGRAWTTGIQDPRAPWGSFFASVQLDDAAFSTAGDYARAYVVNGQRYHHIIDPKTGYPAKACRSVSVWAKSGLVADAIDDAVFVLGPKAGLELVESLEGVGAVIVDGQNQLWISKRLQGKVKVLHLPTDGL